MKPVIKVIGILAILLCIVHIGSASIDVGTITITPSKELVSGQTPVTATFRIDFAASGGVTFDNENTLLLSTELDDAQWNYVVLIDEVENQMPDEFGQNVNIDGWLLSYPSGQEIAMQVRLDGIAPTVSVSGDKTIVRVAELNSRDSVISGTEVIETRYVISPGEVDASIEAMEAELDALKAEMDDKSANGADMSQVQVKYDAARSEITNAERSSSFSDAETYLANAQTYINEGQNLLNLAWAQKLIADADLKIQQTDDLLTYFKVNRSMSSDARLTPIIYDNEGAQDLVSDAKDELSGGNYQEAINKATDANQKAGEAYNSAVALREEIGEGFFGSIGSSIGGALMYIGIILVIVVIGAIGFVLYKRRTRWDELG